MNKIRISKSEIRNKFELHKSQIKYIAEYLSIYFFMIKIIEHNTEIEKEKASARKDLSMEICENLWQVGGAGFTATDDAAIYLIRCGEKAALIDAGCGNGHDKLVDNISAVLPSTVEIEYLLLTHCHYDHTGSRQSAVWLQHCCPLFRCCLSGKRRQRRHGSFLVWHAFGSIDS